MADLLATSIDRILNVVMTRRRQSRGCGPRGFHDQPPSEWPAPGRGCRGQCRSESECAIVLGRPRCGAFTLVELMVVVLITGILASLGFIALKHHAKQAWKAEGSYMVQSIRAAEERWRGENMMYLDVSSPGDSWFPMDPRLSTNREQMFSFYYEPGSGAHSDNDRWLLLRPLAPNSVRFGYKVNAGSAGQAMPVPEVGGSGIALPSPPQHNWYVIQAIGDTDWDGNISFYIASSLDRHIYSVDDGE